MMTDLQDATDRIGKSHAVAMMLKPDHDAVKVLLEAARLVANGTTLWLCIDDHGPEGLKVSNLSGGPSHCFFTGGAHYPLCGEFTLAAAFTPPGDTDDG